MKKIFLLVLVLFSVPVFCMEPEVSENEIPELITSNITHLENKFTITIPSAHIDINGMPGSFREKIERGIVKGFENGVSQIPAYIVMFLVQNAMAEVVYGFPTVRSLWSTIKHWNDYKEIEKFTALAAEVHKYNALVQFDRQVMPAFADSEDPEHQEKFAQMQQKYKDHMDSLSNSKTKFDEFAESISARKLASAA